MTELEEAINTYIQLSVKLGETKRLHKAASERLKSLLQAGGLTTAEFQSGGVKVIRTRTLNMKDPKQKNMFVTELTQKGYPTPFTQYNRYEMYSIAERIFADNHGEIPNWLSYYIDFEKDRTQIRVTHRGAAIRADEDEE